MKTLFITDEKGKKTAAVLSIKDYEKIIEELEELEDIRLYDEAQKSRGIFVPAKEAFKILDVKKGKKA